MTHASSDPSEGPQRESGESGLLFLAWTPISGRSAEIAAALGGEAYCDFDRRLTRRWLVPLRYALSAVRTVRYLARTRPTGLIVTNPPLLPGLLGYWWAKRHGVPIVLDTHPGGFGAQGDRVSERLQAPHRWLASRVDASMVTDEHWVALLESWGGRGIIVHEAPPTWTVEPAGPITGRPRILFVGTFGGDEPIDVLFAAARLVPALDLHVTGDPRRCPAALRDDVPENVTLTGFLQQDAFSAAVEDADVIVTLSTEPTSVMRAAYEAIYAGRPLVLSDWPGLRRLFPSAVRVANEPAALAQGLERAVAERDQLLAASEEARAAQLERWSSQLATLRSVLQPAPGTQLTGASGASAASTPSVEPQRIASLPLSRPTWTQVEAFVRAVLAEGEAATVCTVAPFQAYLFEHDPAYAACLDEAAMVLIDGEGIRRVVAAAGLDPGPKMTGREFTQRVWNDEMLGDLAIAVVGGLPETAERIRAQRPGWLVIDDQLPSLPTEVLVDEVSERLTAFGAELVFVALGSPKMEQWASALCAKHGAVYVSVGGAVDTAVGVRKPPPSWTTTLSVEWAWRAMQDRSLIPRLARGGSVLPQYLRRARRERHARHPLHGDRAR